MDDNELIGDAIKMKLELANTPTSVSRVVAPDVHFEWLGQLVRADDLVNECLRRQPDVIFLDIDMPGTDPIDALRKLSEFVPHVRTLMLTGYLRRDLIERAIEAGAWGYLSKHTGGDSIIRAIVEVANGEFVMGPGVANAYRKR